MLASFFCVVFFFSFFVGTLKENKSRIASRNDILNSKRIFESTTPSSGSDFSWFCCVSLCSLSFFFKEKGLQIQEPGKVLFHHLSHVPSCEQQVGTEWLPVFWERRERKNETWRWRKGVGDESVAAMLPLSQALLALFYLKQGDEKRGQNSSIITKTGQDEDREDT